ncbi:hypothetical protein C0993_000245, partial [Termitomyces sp. T159_Od127]
LNEYIKCKLAQGTSTSTATPAESVDYDALLCQCAPDIAEAMDMLNVPRQASESQQDYEKRQSAARWQANTSRVPWQALLEVETTMSNPAVEREVDPPTEPKMPRQHVTIKEEEHEDHVPGKQVHLVDNWNNCIDYQHIHNQDLQDRGKSLLNNQGVVFEGHGGVMPVDDMRRQFAARTGELDMYLETGNGDEGPYGDWGWDHSNNNGNERDH